MFADLVARGLMTQDSGQDVMDARANRLVRMLQKYPIDACAVVIRKLRGKWMPSVDELEAEILEILGWRLDLLSALHGGHVLSPEEIHSNRANTLAIAMADTLKPLPLWDAGTDRCRQTRETGLITLRAAVKAFCDHVGDKPHPYERELKRAKNWLDMDFIPRPKKETAADRMQQRRETQRLIDGKADELSPMVDDELIEKYAGEWLARGN